MQTFGIVLVVSTGSTTWSLQLVLFFVGAWWFIFTIPAAMWLRPRPGPPLPDPDKVGLARNGSGFSNGYGTVENGNGYYQARKRSW